MAPFRKKASTRLELARTAHAETGEQIGQLEAKRNAALLADDDGTAIKLDAELETLRRLSRGQSDKIKLLEGEAAQEEATRRVRAHEDIIKRVEAKLQKRDEAVAELAGASSKVKAAFEKVLTLSQELDAAWGWSAGDRFTLKLTGTAIQAALANEFFRISHRPFLGGRPGELAQPSLPGSKCSRPAENLGYPEREPPLVSVFEEATNFASQVMRSGGKPGAVVAANGAEPATASSSNGALPAPTSSRERTALEVQLGALLAEQSKLAEDVSSPTAEAAYMKNLDKIAELSAKVDAERQQSETTNHG